MKAYLINLGSLIFGILLVFALFEPIILAKHNPLDGNINLQQSQRRLIKNIQHELLTLSYYGVFDWLEFRLNPEGVVTLSGQVTRPTLKSDAQEAVEDVQGVSSVRNEIEVLPLSPNDDRLRVALYRNIYSGPLFRYSVGSLNSIHIIVKNGRVTLKGVVDTEGDRNIANIRANSVSGVFQVKNELIATNAKRR